MNNLSIGKRLLILLGVGGILLLTIAGIGWKNEKATVDSFKSVYEDRVEPLGDLATIGELLNQNTIELMLAWQHDPKGALAAVHDHPVDMHVEKFAKRKAEITRLWDKYMATYLTPEEKVLAEDFGAKRKAWVEKATELLNRFKSGDFSQETMKEVLAARAQMATATNEALQKLIELQQRVAHQEYEEAMSLHKTGTLWFIILIVGGMAGAGFFSLYLMRSITVPINKSVEIAEAIAGGDLTQPVPKGGGDEAGRLLAAFAHMQDSLRIMVGGRRRMPRS